MPERTCPICNAALILDEVYDGDTNFSIREEVWYGHCPHCGQGYRWTEVYTYTETKFFEVVEEEDN